MLEFTPEKIETQQERKGGNLEEIINNIAMNLTSMRVELANLQDKKLEYMSPAEAAKVLAEVDPQIKLLEREIVRLEGVLTQLKNLLDRRNEVLANRFNTTTSAANDPKQQQPAQG